MRLAQPNIFAGQNAMPGRRNGKLYVIGSTLYQIADFFKEYISATGASQGCKNRKHRWRLDGYAIIETRAGYA